MVKNYGCERCKKDFYTIEGVIAHKIFYHKDSIKDVFKNWKLILPKLLITKFGVWLGQKLGILIMWLGYATFYLLYYISLPLSKFHLWVKAYLNK